MKVIVSHDVDHIHLWDHTNDLIIPKFLARNFLEVLFGTTKVAEFFKRGKVLFTNRWERIPEILEFDRGHGIPSTFFFGMSKGCNLAYSVDAAIPLIKYVSGQGFEAGVHGIAFDDPGKMQEEFRLFAEISGKSDFGIRMHYLRQDDSTLQNLERCGYRFDSTRPSIEGPVKTGNIWEFPLHIMDGDMVYQGNSFSRTGLDGVQALTEKKMKEAEEAGIPYLTILFHDLYFDDSFSLWKKWYAWIIDLCTSRGYTFIDYKTAIRELEQKEIHTT